ncbi:MAG TPA: 4-(cytidine 5'-diphospho)-2-C-methyl-D-erythritol kinase [Longimicrobiaceae bacterium]|nr:4-(cytidine 5'-diphospho)-2-C-methyl-D-erythritol kinase [Longimicrobiaceae bacterium]
MATEVVREAPAKVNLRLAVLAQETSGYHALESLFCALSLHDTVRVSRGGEEIELVTEGAIDTGPDHENLVVRAARRFLLEMGGVDGGVRIRLEKRIPSAAGLGGGSSDAAATLLALNDLFEAPFASEALLQMGSELGSDVPFFLCGSPLALGWGRGERLLALPPLPSRPVLVAHPGVAMPTGSAFQRLAELRGGAFRPPAVAIPSDALSDWDRLSPFAVNDFEPAADERLPQLATARQALREAGAGMALLAGSGASVFGVFHDAGARDAAEPAVQRLGFSTWRAHTLSGGTVG